MSECPVCSRWMTKLQFTSHVIGYKVGSENASDNVQSNLSKFMHDTRCLSGCCTEQMVSSHTLTCSTCLLSLDCRTADTVATETPGLISAGTRDLASWMFTERKETEILNIRNRYRLIQFYITDTIYLHNLHNILMLFDQSCYCHQKLNIKKIYIWKHFT